MQVTVELFGRARELANAKTIELELVEGATFREALSALAHRCPNLVGPVIAPDHDGDSPVDLVPPYMFNVDGRHTISDLDACTKHGQRLILLLASAGG